MKILVVDDEKTNREIIDEYLRDEGHELLYAKDGSEGWEKLNCNPDTSIILLDKMMPKLNGMQFLQMLKQKKELAHIPVIMQTADCNNDSVVEGINYGAYYYLTKPYKRKILVSLVNSAANYVKKTKALLDDLKKQQSTISFLTEGKFQIKTMSQAQDLSFFLACAYPDPSRVILGISEMLINAIEHGNLGITTDQKSELVRTNKLITETSRLAKKPENKDKKVLIDFKRNEKSIRLKIKDEGDGFDWKPFFELDSNRLCEPNGRGILMAKMMSFDEINYKGNGSEVECIIKLYNDSQ